VNKLEIPSGRRYRVSKLPLFLVLAAMSAAAIPVAQMALPPDFAARAVRITIDGFGGRNRGDYLLREPDGTTFSGEFSRAESRLGVLDPLLVRSKAKGAFSFVDSSTDVSIKADCDMRKLTVNVDIVTVDAKKLVYQCEFRSDGALTDARLFIGQPKRQGLKQKLLAQDLRYGEADLFGQRLSIESVHEYRGSKLGSQSAVGYLLKSGDNLVAAVELTDVDPGLYIVEDLSADMRRIIYVTALAIGVFRDPADSALDAE